MFNKGKKIFSHPSFRRFSSESKISSSDKYLNLKVAAMFTIGAFLGYNSYTKSSSYVKNKANSKPGYISKNMSRVLETPRENYQ